MSDLEQEFAEAFAEKIGAQGQPEPQEVPQEPVAAPEAPQEVQPEVQAEGEDGRLRDPETGQFTTQEEYDRKYGGGRFATPEELDADWQEKNSRIGSMANELGTLRAEKAQYEAYLQQLQAQQNQQRQLQAMPNLDEDPAGFTQAALRAGDLNAYRLGLARWADEEPGQALIFHSEVQQGWLQAQVAQREQAQVMQQSTTTAAWNQVRASNPDFDLHKDKFEAVLELVPDLAPRVSQGSAEEKVRAMEAILYVARGMQAQAAPAPQPQAAPGQHPLAQRVAATVAPPANGGAPQGEQLPPHLRAQAELRALWDAGELDMSR